MEQLFIFISFKEFFKSWNVIVIGIFVLKSKIVFERMWFWLFFKVFFI
jgi:hypothetical protein